MALCECERVCVCVERIRVAIVFCVKLLIVWDWLDGQMNKELYINWDPLRYRAKFRTENCNASSLRRFCCSDMVVADCITRAWTRSGRRAKSAFTNETQFIRLGELNCRSKTTLNEFPKREKKSTELSSAVQRQQFSTFCPVPAWITFCVWFRVCTPLDFMCACVCRLRVYASHCSMDE